MVSTTTPSSGEFLLEMNGINKSFPGVKALDNVNLKVRPHSIHALMGENGAGKYLYGSPGIEPGTATLGNG